MKQSVVMVGLTKLVDSNIIILYNYSKLYYCFLKKVWKSVTTLFIYYDTFLKLHNKSVLFSDFQSTHFQA